MNIFQIFSHGNGRLSETNLTSVLAFLFDPFESHGFGPSFLYEFLLPLKNEIQSLESKKFFFEQISTPLKKSSLNFYVNIEQRFTSKSTKSRILDILITIKDKGDNELLKIGIENKIKVESSYDDMQLIDEVNHLIQNKDEETLLIFFYITPHTVTVESDSLWKGLTEHVKQNKRSNLIIKNYSWGKRGNYESEDQSGNLASQTFCLKRVCEAILEKERTGKIDPASSHSDLLLRSLIRFIDSDIAPDRSIKSAEADYSMGIISDSDKFWEQQWGPKEKSMMFAQGLTKILDEIIEKELLNNEKYKSQRYELKHRATQTRYSGFLADQAFTNHGQRILPGRLYRLRADGSTNTKVVEIMFSLIQGKEISELENGMPEGVSAEFKDSSNEARVFITVDQRQLNYPAENQFANYFKNLLLNFSIPFAMQDLQNR